MLISKMIVRQLQPSDVAVIIKHAHNHITWKIAVISCFAGGYILVYFWVFISWINISFKRITMFVCLFACVFFFFCLVLVFAVFFFFALRDRFRTTVNVLGDSIVAGVVEHLSREDLKYFDDYNGGVDEIIPLSNRDESREFEEVAITTRL